MQPKTTPPSPRRSKKRTLKVVFSLQLFFCLRHPLGTHLNPNPVRPAYVAATTDGQGHPRGSYLRSGCTKPGQNPRMSTHCPPIHALPRPRSDPQDVDDVSMGRADRGSSIAPTGLRRRNGPRRVDVRTPPPRVSRSRTVSTASRLHTAHSDNAPKAEKAEKKGDRRGTGTPDRQTKTQTEAY